MKLSFVSLSSIVLLLPQTSKSLQQPSPTNLRELLQSSSSSSSSSSSLGGSYSSRRGFLATSCSTFLLGAIGSQPRVANAVEPLTNKEAEMGIGLPFKARPKPPTALPRQKINHDFAVLLTRSTFSEAVQLEMGSSTQLERDMYLVRTSELDPYRQQLGNGVTMALGDLDDPYYFDYMSYVQYATINRAMRDPESTYQQMEPVVVEGGIQTDDYETVQVTRSVATELLPSTFDARVGRAILDFFQDRNKGTSLAIPDYGERPGMTQVWQALTKLTNLFLMSGFAWEGRAEMLNQKDNQRATFQLTLDNPAILWSSQCLGKQSKTLVRNDFLLKAAKQLVASMGYSVTSSSTKIVKGNQEVNVLTIQ